MKKMELESDKFFKVNFDTTGIEDDIYSQIAKTMARGMDIDLAKTPLVDVLTGYTRYKALEFRINKAIEYINRRIEDINNGGNEHEYRNISHILDILKGSDKE